MMKVKKVRKLMKNNKKMLLMMASFLCLFFIVPAVVAQSGSVKISSLAEVESTTQDASNTVLNIAKYLLGAVLAVGLIFVVYSIATKNPNAKDYLLAWVIAVIVVIIGNMII